MIGTGGRWTSIYQESIFVIRNGESIREKRTRELGYKKRTLYEAV